MSTEPSRWVWPDFHGRGLVNLAPSLLEIAGLEGIAQAACLSPEVLPRRFTHDLDTILLFLVDGMGKGQLEAAIASGIAPTMARLSSGAGKSHVGTLTSVFPSSTVPALMSISSGVSPGHHGLLGWVTHIEELGGPTEIVRWGPASRPGVWPGLVTEGLRPLDLLTVRTVHEQLAATGVESVAVGPANHMGSPFTTMLYRGTADYIPYEKEPDLWMGVRDALARPTRSRKRMVYIYHHMVDHFAHVRGPTSDEHAAAIAEVDTLVDRIAGVIEPHDRALLLVTADHGHVATEARWLVDLAAHPGLLSELVVHPTGERRVMYLHVKPGRVEAALAYVREHLADSIVVFRSEDLVARGIFGPGEPSVAARRRMGDLTLLPAGPHQLVCTGANVRPTVSHFGDHGSLEPEEMYIPLIALRT